MINIVFNTQYFAQGRFGLEMLQSSLASEATCEMASHDSAGQLHPLAMNHAGSIDEEERDVVHLICTEYAQNPSRIGEDHFTRKRSAIDGGQSRILNARYEQPYGVDQPIEPITEILDQYSILFFGGEAEIERVSNQVRDVNGEKSFRRSHETNRMQPRKIKILAGPQPDPSQPQKPFFCSISQQCHHHMKNNSSRKEKPGNSVS